MCTIMKYVQWMELRIFVAVSDFFSSPFPCQDLYQSGFSYHMAISGKSFAVLCDHFPQDLPKVLT